MDGASMAEADALALVAMARRDLQAAHGMTDTTTFHEAVWGFYRDLARFTDFAVQIRYDDQPELQNLDRSIWNDRVDALVTSVEALLTPPAEP